MSSVPCPTCGKLVKWSESSQWRPFCSERCRLIDLGEWISESHRIAGDPVDDGDETSEEPDPQT
jgi:uncharacterized protein